MARLRRLFGKQADPYAGANLRTALRIGSVLWLMGVGISFVLWPLSPPDREIGEVGWLIASVLALGGIACFFAFRSERIAWTFDALYISAFATVAAIALMQWLAGGVGAPYERLLLLAVVYVASIHPPLRIAAFLATIALALAAPFVYGGWDRDAGAGSLATLMIWCAVAWITYLLMSRVRAQRLRMKVGTDQAREEARIDNLTGIGNRRAFEEAIENEVARARRTNVVLSMVLGDIAYFKRINDEWGHVEGDRCLRSVAAALEGAMRVPDRCFRWGGDEFAMLLPGTPAEGAERVAERLDFHVRATARRPDGEPLQIRFGTAELGEGMEARALVEAADQALRTAKSQV